MSFRALSRQATSYLPTYSRCRKRGGSRFAFEIKDASYTASSDAAFGVLLRLKRHASSRKAPARMQAWEIYQYGGNEELVFSDTARGATIKGPKDLLIQVHAASINPIDVKMRGGYASKAINLLRAQAGQTGSEFPLILGRDFSGVVVETGQGVKKFKPGDEVWGALNGFRQGSLAQYTVASESEISKKPKSVSHTEAASIPYVACTAWTALSTVGELKEKNARGKRVLIQGGGGGIGTFAVQLLKAWGADVTVTCQADAEDLLLSLGADTVVDYRQKGAARKLASLPPFDFVLDAVGGKTTDDSFDLLKKWTNAKLVTLVSPVFKNLDDLGLVQGAAQTAFSLGSNLFRGFSGGRSYRWSIFLANGKALATVAQLVDRGMIQPVVDQEFPFQQTPAAFEKVESGNNRGKTVVNVIDTQANTDIEEKEQSKDANGSNT